MMMATDHVDTSLAFMLERKSSARDDSDNDAVPSDMDDFSSLSIPSISMNGVDVGECSDGFLRLTTMVRAVYLSYLRECLLSNYMNCYEGKYAEYKTRQSTKINNCADHMELIAVRLALETSLYRQNMLRMIADVKSHTIQKKPYEKLIEFLETSNNKIDATIQTDGTWMNLHDMNDIEDTYVRSDCEELSQATLSVVRSNENGKISKEIDNEANLQLLKKMANQEGCDVDQETMVVTDSQMMNLDAIKNENDDSQDSLLRHMEDMFCESDDSSDLTQLIEKHSDITKASIDREIHKICLEAADINPPTNDSGLSRSNDVVRNRIPRMSTGRGKLTFSRYKEMRNKIAAETLKEVNGNETLEEKRKRRINAVWFVERVHQVSKLRAKMTELSLMNYRKHGRIKEKFVYLFGDSEEEEMMPDSPICIEEHLPACKERIAPWIVQYLMPFYKKRKIKDRQLFKAVAKYIANMLIMKNTFPEQECVSEYIQNYFKNKKFIKTKQDVYL